MMPVHSSERELTVTFLRTEIHQVVLRVWDNFLGLELNPIDGCQLTSCQEQGVELAGAVAWIGGFWTGNIRLIMPKSLAHLLAVHLLATEEIENEQIDDALRELANMIAGNLKAVLPGESALATPGNFTLRPGQDPSEGFIPVASCWYECLGHSMWVSIYGLDGPVEG